MSSKSRDNDQTDDSPAENDRKAGSKQLRKQQDDMAKQIASFAGAGVAKGFGEQLRKQQDDMAKQIASFAGAGVIKGVGRSDTQRLQKLFETLSSVPELHHVRDPNQRIAVKIGRLGALTGVQDERDVAEGRTSAQVPESLHDELMETAQLLTAVGDALPVEAEQVGGREDLETAAVEVFAVLAALITLSALAGFWLSEASRTGAPPITQISRWQLMCDAYLLYSATRWMWTSTRRLLQPSGGRAFFRDEKSYAVVEDLAQLRGPAGGVVELSHSVLWAPGGGRVDLDRAGELRMAYRAVLNEGTVEDLKGVLNRDRLVAVWPELLLPLRVLELWSPGSPS